MTVPASAADAADARKSQASFGAQVRGFRAARRLTAARLAERCGVSRSLISQIETGRISPSLDVVRRLAAALDVPIAALFGPETPALAGASVGSVDGPATTTTTTMATMTAATVPAANGMSVAGGAPAGAPPAATVAPRVALVRRDERKGLRLPKSKITYELLSPDLRGDLQVQWVVLAPGERAPADGFVHRGEECYVVLRGTVRFRVAQLEFLLEEGDALTFDSSLPHGASNDGPGTAVALAAMTPPSF